jgi:hypothetical protein
MCAFELFLKAPIGVCRKRRDVAPRLVVTGQKVLDSATKGMQFGHMQFCSNTQPVQSVLHSG